MYRNWLQKHFRKCGLNIDGKPWTQKMKPLKSRKDLVIHFSQKYSTMEIPSNSYWRVAGMYCIKELQTGQIVRRIVQNSYLEDFQTSEQPMGSVWGLVSYLKIQKIKS